jgi:spoIIIJ-associated protein
MSTWKQSARVRGPVLARPVPRVADDERTTMSESQADPENVDVDAELVAEIEADDLIDDDNGDPVDEVHDVDEDDDEDDDGDLDDVESSDDDERTDADAAGTADSETDGVGRLEREGDIAADYLEELLDIADFDGDIDLDVENDRAMVSIVGSGLGNLVGQRGATLDALQDLTRLAVLRATGERSRLMLDIAGTRARRKVQLHQVGTDAAEQARSSGAPVRLDPMTPFERKVVHDAVAAAGLRSESDGVEPNRRVVVYPS